MEVMWQREAGDVSETAIRLILDEDGCIMFQYQVRGSAWMDRRRRSPHPI